MTFCFSARTDHVRLCNHINYLVIISLTAATLFGCKPASEQSKIISTPLALPVGLVHESSEITYSEYPASIQGSVDIEIRPQISGYIQNVLVNEGAYVPAGQTLFTINPQPFAEGQ